MHRVLKQHRRNRPAGIINDTILTRPSLVAQTGEGRPVFWYVVHPFCDMHCSACGADTSHIDLVHVGRSEFMRCTKHKIAESIGSNLLSSWQHQTQDEWNANLREIEEHYNETTSFHPGNIDQAPVVVQAQILAAMDQDDASRRDESGAK